MRYPMRTFFGVTMLLAFILLMFCASGQTRIDGTQQVKNSPVVSVQRAQCVGSGTGTNSNGTTYSWNCGGLQLYKLILLDGTTLGPYVAIPATPQQASLALWQTLPLSAPDPTIP